MLDLNRTALATFLYGIYFGLVFAPLYNFFHGE
jgi:hypothetical protein